MSAREGCVSGVDSESRAVDGFLMNDCPHFKACDVVFCVHSSSERYKRTDNNGALGDHGAVSLVDDVVDGLEVVRIRDDLVIGEDILL